MPRADVENTTINDGWQSRKAIRQTGSDFLAFVVFCKR